jgi:hypothetical protein
LGGIIAGRDATFAPFDQGEPSALPYAAGATSVVTLPVIGTSGPAGGFELVGGYTAGGMEYEGGALETGGYTAGGA